MLERLSRKLNYHFKRPELLQVALTHRSMRGDNNERLEFLGDAILSFIISSELYRLHCDATEGELSRMRANLVNRETLAELARAFELGPYLRLGSGELKSGGFQRASILADTLEAIIGAIYLDANIEQCRAIVLKWYGERLEQLFNSDIHKDAKTKLQEYLQRFKLPLPEYTVLSITGEDHAQSFHVACQVAGIGFTTEGYANSRRKAEQQAAHAFLAQLEGKVG